jgi:hypothetical protein
MVSFCTVFSQGELTSSLLQEIMALYGCSMAEVVSVVWPLLGRLV